MLLIRNLYAYIKKNSTSVRQDALLCFGATLTCGFYFFEYYQPYMNVFRIFLIAMLIFVWAFYSLKNGMRGNLSFLIFSILYWLLPLLISIYANKTQFLFGYSKDSYAIGIICELMVIFPIDKLTSVLNVTPQTTPLFMTFLITLIYIGAGFIPSKCSDNLCS